MKFFSTRSSINNDIPSFTGIIETLLAIVIYWWVAIRYETYLPLMLSAFAVLLLLLRSDESTALGKRLFLAWEKNVTQSQTSYRTLLLLRQKANLVASSFGRTVIALSITIVGAMSFLLV